jgi:hypothetical protein
MLKELLESLHEKQSHVLGLLDTAKAKKLIGTRADDNWDYMVKESINRLKILDLWL